MPWVAPKTDFVNGDVLTATQMNNIGGDLAMFNGGTTGQVLSKASNANGDFAWTSETDPNAIPKTLIDAKGDLIAGSAADTAARLAVGSNGQVLTADSTTATGLKWAAASSGGFTLISTTTLSGSSTTLSSIPQTYQHLYLVLEDISLSSSANLWVSCNADTGGQDTSGVSGGTTYSTTSSPYRPWGVTNNTNTNNVTSIWIYDYASTTQFKAISSFGRHVDTSSVQRGELAAGAYFSNSAVSSILISNSGSVTLTGTAILYGVK